jgi:Protein of unknown function (DUF2568)
VEALKALNLGVRFFVVELGGLAAAAYWGWEATSGPGRWYLAVAAPAAFIAVWGLFISPRARSQVSKHVALAIELVLLGVVAIGLAVAGPAWLGIAYGAVALVSGLLNYAFKP